MRFFLSLLLLCCFSLGVNAASEIRLQGRATFWYTIDDGDLTPSQAVTQFGTVNYGSSKTQRYRIQNRGESSLTVRGVSSDEADFEVSGLPSGSFQIPANDDVEFEISFSPTALTRSATITVRNTDPDPAKQFYTFAVTGDGKGPEIQVLGRSFPNNPNYLIENGDGATQSSGGRFDAFIDEPSTHYFSIRNEGTDDLVISSPSIVAGTSLFPRPEFFSILSLGSSTRIQSGDTHEFEIRCLADEIGSFNATFQMSTNDPDEEDFEFSLQAVVGGKARLVLEQYDGSSWEEIEDTDSDPDATSLSFGSTELFNPLTRSFRISNPGTEDLEIYEFTSTGEDFSLGSLPEVVVAGASKTFSIQFEPSSVGAVESQIRISTNARPAIGNTGEARIFTFLASGTGLEPSLLPELAVANTSGDLIDNGSTTPTPELGTDFGSMASGYLQRSQTFVLFNLGEADLTTEEISFSENTIFSIGQTEITFPFSLEAQSLQLLTVSVSNRQPPGTYHSTMTIETNDAANSPFTLPLTITLTEPSPGEIDDLRIVDGRLKFTMLGSEGVRYQFERSSDLSEGSWTLVSGVAPWILEGDEREFALVIPADQPSQFYRFVPLDPE